MFVRINTRVKLHPATDWWMRGTTHGTVVKIGRKLRERALLRYALIPTAEDLDRGT